MSAPQKAKLGRPSANAPIRGWAMRPLIGPASHTRLAACSDRPSCSRNGVPQLSRFVNFQSSLESSQKGTTHPSSIVQMIWAPIIETESAMRSKVDIWLFAGPAASPPALRDGRREPRTFGPSSSSDPTEPKLPARRRPVMGGRYPVVSGECSSVRPLGHGIWTERC